MTYACADSIGSLRARTGRLAWLAVAAVILAACASAGGPAPVFDRSYGNRVAAPPPVEPGTHLVQSGETVYGVAQRYNVSTRALIERNDLRPPYMLASGLRLRIPTAQAHIVARGDTLYGISRRYGIDMATLARANQLDPPYTIHVGQQLGLPLDGQTAAPPPTQVARALPDDGAPPFAAAPQSSAPQPSTPQPSTPQTSTPQVNAPLENAAAPSVPQPVAAPAGAAPSVAPPSVAGVPRPKPAFQPDPPPPPRDSGGFVWPVDGRVLSGFGADQAGLHNDGLNIAAPKGAPVRAADNGVVAYAGNQIRGFGNLLLIKHDGGLITAYAHADKLLVGRGDVVSRGQVVARVGQSGSVEAPQLHFEVRQGSRAVDPRKFLPS